MADDYVPTFADFAEEYLETRGPTFAPSTQREVRYAVNRLVDYFASRRLDEITPQHIERFKASRLGTVSKRTGRRLAPSTVQRELGVLKTMLEHALLWGRCDSNPARDVRPVRGHDRRRERWLRWSEYERLRDACHDWLRVYVIVGMHTGMRPGELRGLRWEQVELWEPGKGGLVYLGESKTGQARRVPLSTTAADALRSWPRRIDSPFVFPGRSPDSPWTRQVLAKLFRRAVEQAELETSGPAKVTPHTLRHSFATHYLQRGGSIRDLMQIAGWTSIETAERYAHASDDSMRLGVEALER